ncbi:MAG: DnaD domain protein, partial [Chloroflexi bacterium]|nr:DnaD domain protein [Chloroflexota bacterium]
TLLEAAGRYLLNTPENRRSAARLTPLPSTPPPEPVVVERPNVFALYEANVGMLTPMVAEQLREAEATYPAEWIEGAIREAAERNARSWRYIATILERWASDGRRSDGPRQERHGESGRHPETLTAADLLRRRRLSG